MRISHYIEDVIVNTTALTTLVAVKQPIARAASFGIIANLVQKCFLSYSIDRYDNDGYRQLRRCFKHSNHWHLANALVWSLPQIATRFNVISKSAHLNTFFVIAHIFARTLYTFIDRKDANDYFAESYRDLMGKSTMISLAVSTLEIAAAPAFLGIGKHVYTMLKPSSPLKIPFSLLTRFIGF